MRVLITGGNGFVGRDLVAALEANHEVYLADITLPDNKSVDLLRSIKLDVIDSKRVEEIISTTKPEIICHLAAKVSFRWSLEEPVKDLFLHVLGTLNVLEAARKIKPHPHIVYAGSSSIFGNANIVPTPEDCPANPTSPYGVSKLAGEKYCEMYERVYGVPITILRFTNIYGPSSEKGVVYAFISRILKGEPITIFGGDQELQFEYVSDAIQAYRIVIEKKITGTFNIGGPDVVTLKELAELIMEEAGRSVPVEIRPPVEGDIKQVIFDTTKAKKELDWRPVVSIREGIRRCLEYSRARLAIEMPTLSDNK